MLQRLTLAVYVHNARKATSAVTRLQHLNSVATPIPVQQERRPSLQAQTVKPGRIAPTLWRLSVLMENISTNQTTRARIVQRAPLASTETSLMFCRSSLIMATTPQRA